MIDDKDLSDLYRLGAVEKPPESLDEKILHQAHMATVRQSRWRRWQWPASAVASVMLCTTLFMLYTDKSEFEVTVPAMTPSISEQMTLPSLQDQIQPGAILADDRNLEIDVKSDKTLDKDDSDVPFEKERMENKAKKSISSKARQVESRAHKENRILMTPAPQAVRELPALGAAKEISGSELTVPKKKRAPEPETLNAESGLKREIYAPAKLQQRSASKSILPGVATDVAGAAEAAVSGASDESMQVQMPKRQKTVHPQYSPETGKVTPHHLVKPKQKKLSNEQSLEKQEQQILSEEQYVKAIKRALAEGDREEARRLLQELKSNYPEAWGQTELESFEQ